MFNCCYGTLFLSVMNIWCITEIIWNHFFSFLYYCVPRIPRPFIHKEIMCWNECFNSEIRKEDDNMFLARQRINMFCFVHVSTKYTGAGTVLQRVALCKALFVLLGCWDVTQILVRWAIASFMSLDLSNGVAFGMVDHATSINSRQKGKHVKY